MRKYRVIIYPKYDLELDWRVRESYFDIDRPEFRTCMRCGQKMRYPLAQNALSRALKFYVCPECGMDEALRDATGEILPMSEWYIVKHHYFGEHEPPNTSRLLWDCRFQQVFSGPKKTLPLNNVLFPVSLIAYSRSDLRGTNGGRPGSPVRRKRHCRKWPLKWTGSWMRFSLCRSSRPCGA